MSTPSNRKLLIVNAILLAIILAVLLIVNYDALTNKLFSNPTYDYETDNKDDAEDKHYTKQDSIQDDFEDLKNDTLNLTEEIIKMMETELKIYNWNEEFQYEDLFSIYHRTVFTRQLQFEHMVFKKLIVITFTNYGGNHGRACAGRISLFEFQKEGKNWQMTKHYLAFGYGDEDGFEPSRLELVQIGNNNKYAVIVHTSYSGTGGHDTQTQYVYTEVDQEFNLVFDFTRYEYYFSPPQDFEYTEGYSSMRIMESNKAWFDIETKSGAKYWNENTDGADKRFIFNGKEYVEAKRKTH